MKLKTYEFFSFSFGSNTLLSSLALYSHTVLIDVFSRLWITFQINTKRHRLIFRLSHGDGNKRILNKEAANIPLI
jgi:hypothetical protein